MSAGCPAPLSLGDVHGLVRARVAEETSSQLRHALRNKLAAVKSAGLYLSRRLAGAAEAAADPRIPQFFKIIDDETRAACDLLEATREPPPAAPPVHPPLDAAGLVAELVGLLRTPRLVVEAPAPVLVPVPRDDLVVAVHCLLENALDAGATASVAIAGAPRPLVRVRDDGPGFPPAGTPPTPRPGRRNLGLKIARRLAAGWGGEVLVEAAARGASVVLSLPAASSAAAPGEAAPAAARRGRLLLLDDDVSNRVTLAALLEDAGWEVREAGSVAEARPQLGGLDVAVFDVTLRDGDGTSLVLPLRTASPSALAVLLTGDSSVTRGAADLTLIKGVDPLEIVATIGDAAAARGRTA